MFPLKLLTRSDFLALLLFIIVEMFILARGCSGNVSNRQPDFTKWSRAISPLTTDTTRPRTFPTQSLYSKKIDTLDMVVSQYLGHSMTVDNSDLVKQIFFRITRELRSDTTLKR